MYHNYYSIVFQNNFKNKLHYFQYIKYAFILEKKLSI